MFRAGQARHEGGGLFEELGEPLAFLAGAAGGEDLLGGLGADHQDAADAVRRVIIVDGTVAVGPVDVFAPPVAGDRDQRVFPARLGRRRS